MYIQSTAANYILIYLFINLLLMIFYYIIIKFISLTISKVVLQISCLYNINIFMDIVAFYKKVSVC